MIIYIGKNKSHSPCSYWNKDNEVGINTPIDFSKSFETWSFGTNTSISCLNFWDKACLFLWLRVFRLLSSSLLLFPVEITIKMKTIIRKPLMIKIQACTKRFIGWSVHMMIPYLLLMIFLTNEIQALQHQWICVDLRGDPMLKKNKPHLVTFYKSILVSLWTSQPALTTLSKKKILQVHFLASFWIKQKR